MPTELTVDEDGVGERLDKFLARSLANTSRSKIQKMIERNEVTINDKVKPAHYLLHRNDRIRVVDEHLETLPAPAQSIPAPTIVFEDNDFLVIDKPSGLTVHLGPGVREPTLVDWLKTHVPTIATVGDDPEQRPGIVHRLDKDVSGVMVVAKTQRAFEHLKQQFQNRSIEKEYVALVHGIPKKQSGTIDFPITRSRRQHGRMSARPLLTKEGMAEGQGRREGREAITHYAVEQRVKTNALLRVTTETGRTHQIRVHLKALGHPIVGDSVYTTKPVRRKKTMLDRPFLHAQRLAFTDFEGKRREFSAPLPEELRKFI